MHTLQLEAAWATGRAATTSRCGCSRERRRGRAPRRVRRGAPDERDINVLVPGRRTTSRRSSGSPSRATGARLTRALLPYEHVRVTLVRDHPGRRPPLVARRTRGSRWSADPAWDAHERGPGRQARPGGAARGAPTRSRSGPPRFERSTPRSIPIARCTSPTRGCTSGVPVPLDVVECWDRNVAADARGRGHRTRPPRGRGHRRDAPPRLPEAPSAAPARPNEPTDRPQRSGTIRTST